MKASSDELFTVREIAEALGEPKHRILYALRRRRSAINPTACASQTMLFDRSIVPTVRAILRGIDANRSGGLRFAGLDEKRSV